MENIRREISDILKELGVPNHLDGYDLLIDAIEMVWRDYSKRKAITTVIYPDIAKKYNKKVGCVERNMRNAIVVSTGRGDKDKMHQLFGCSIDPEKGRATNGQFIISVAKYLQPHLNKNVIYLFNEQYNSSGCSLIATSDKETLLNRIKKEDICYVGWDNYYITCVDAITGEALEDDEVADEATKLIETYKDEEAWKKRKDYEQKNISKIPITNYDEYRENQTNNQSIFKFKNGYGASVIDKSYGLELAVIIFDTDNGGYDTCYDTPITDDVVGWLDVRDVNNYLKRIKELNPRKEQ